MHMVIVNVKRFHFSHFKTINYFILVLVNIEYFVLINDILFYSKYSFKLKKLVITLSLSTIIK